MKTPASLSSAAQFCIARALWEPRSLANESELEFHREQTEESLRQLELPPRLESDVLRVLSLVADAYIDCSYWFQIYEMQRISVFHSLEFISNDAKYCCTAFMTPEGEFSDVEWVKLFVSDQQQPILDRFYFACFYCFVEDITLLWQQILRNGWPPDYCNKNFSNIRLSAPSLVSFWIHYLEGKQVELLGGRTDSFFFYGMKRATSAGHLKAVDFFWQNLSVQERNSMLVDVHVYARVVCLAARKRHSKVVHYLYTQLTTEQQRTVLLYDIRKNVHCSIWCDGYLQPVFIRLFPAQIAAHQDRLSATVYSDIILNLACKIYYFSSAGINNSTYEDVFKEVWHLGTTNNKNYLLMNRTNVLKVLLISKKYTCAECLLKYSSLEHKQRFLFGRFGRLIFQELVCEQDWEGIEEHFMLFLINLNGAESTQTLFHDYSLRLMAEFKEKSWFYNWIKNTVPTRAAPLEKAMNNVSQQIHVNDLLKDLLLKAEKMSSLH